jgi:hypothetical protein
MYGALNNNERSADRSDVPSYIRPGGELEQPVETLVDASSLSVPMERFVAVLQKRAERGAACRMAPWSIAIYAVACFLIIAHGHVDVTYDMETALVNTVVLANGGFPTTVVDENR